MPQGFCWPTFFEGEGAIFLGGLGICWGRPYITIASYLYEGECAVFLAGVEPLDGGNHAAVVNLAME